MADAASPDASAAGEDMLQRLQRSPAVVAGAGFLVMMASGAVWGSFTLFLVAIADDTGWSKTSIALGFTVFTFLGACAAPLTGWMTDRWGSQPVLAGLAVVFAAGIGLASLSDQPAIFYLTFGVLAGLGSQSCGSYTLFTIAGNWFRRPATAMAVMDSGSGIGTLLSLPVLQLVIEAHSWRVAYVALGLFVLVLVLPLTAMFMRLHPPGAEPSARRGGEPGRRSPLGAVQAIAASRTLRWFAAIHVAAPLVFHAIASHQIAYFHHAGVDPDLAVLLVASTGFTFFAARLAFGALIDWRGLLDAGIVKAIAAFGTLALLFALPALAGSPAALAFPVLFALGFCATNLLYANAARQIIDPASFSAVFGAVRLLYGTGVAMGPPIMAAMVEATGRYDLPFACIGALMLAQHAVFIALARRRRRSG
jgi:OFA family oxalate/formate antiporter-like MFS transporter